MRHYLQLLEHVSPDELLKKALRKPVRALDLYLEERHARKALADGRVDEVLEHAVIGYRGRGPWLEDLRSGRRPALFTEWDGNLLGTFIERFPDAVNATLNEAQHTCRHCFDMLGSGPTQLGEHIDWHADFKSGKRWEPHLYSKRIRMNGLRGADILVPWWLSSFYHVMALGKAYLLSGDGRAEANQEDAGEVYAEEFLRQITDWIKTNPYPFGVNWASSTAVSVRLIHWIWGYFFFWRSSAIPDAFWWEYLKHLYLHALHVRRNLEWFHVRTNHYLSNLAALFFVGLLFPELPDAHNWREFAYRELISEIEHHVYPDGVAHEGSVNYHRFVTEILLTVFLLGRQHGLEFPAPYSERLEKMLEFILYYSSPGGTAPRVGDAAPIALQSLGQPDLIGDHRWLLAIGAVVFDRPDFKAAGGDPPEALLWLLGPQGLASYDRLPIPKSDSRTNEVTARSWREGGFHILRGKDFYLLIRCGPLGMQGVRGHWHYDQLSFELWIQGRPILIDPGWYCYEADEAEMRRFKSTAYHNTVVADARDQIKDDLFMYPPPRRPEPELLRWDTAGDRTVFLGEHRLYSDLAQPVVHRRRIDYDKADGRLTIEDSLEESGTHQLDWFFHFAPGVTVKTDGDDSEFEAGSVKGTLSPSASVDLRAEAIEGWVAPRYGERCTGQILHYVTRCPLPVKVRFEISVRSTQP